MVCVQKTRHCSLIAYLGYTSLVSLFWPEFVMKIGLALHFGWSSHFQIGYEPLMESPFVLDVQYSKDDRTILYTGSGDTRSNRKGGVR